MNTVADTKTTNLLRTKRYALFWVSSLFSNIGTWMQQVAQPWIILSITNSSFWVGMDSFTLNAPGWLFTLWGGSLADRFDKKRIVLFCQFIQFLCVAILFTLLLEDQLQIWIILFCSFIIGTTDSLSMPSFQSIIPSLVSEKDMSRAIALNSTQFNLSRVLGPALAGLVIAAYGAKVCYGANLVSYIPFFLSLYFIYPKNGFPIAEMMPGAAHGEEEIRHFRQIVRMREFHIPMITVFITNLFCGPIIVFSPVIVKNIFMGDATKLGVSMTCFGIGGVLGGVISSLMPIKIYESKAFPNVMAAFLGFVLILVSVIPSLFTFDILLAFAGLALTMSNTASNSHLQRSAKNHIRGRVISLFQMCLQSGISLGSLLTGTLTTNLGIQIALLFNGFIAVILQLSILYFHTRIKR